MRSTTLELLKAGVTNYKIAKEAKINQKAISELCSGKRQLDNITFLTTEKLYEYVKAHLNY